MQPPVIAVICHYNMVQTLRPLLNQIEAQGYDSMYVLDDASTDRSIEKIEDEFPVVNFIYGKQNLGPGGNRNRILNPHNRLPSNAILHFVDADVKLLSKNTAAIIRRKYTALPKQMIGGLVKMPDGRPSMFNYGPRHSLYAGISGGAVMLLNYIYDKSPKMAEIYFHCFSFLLKDSPNILKPVKRRPIFWCEEANLIIPYRLFKTLKGFNEKLRYHEIQDLAIRLQKIGIPRYFDADIVVEHPLFTMDKARWLRQHKADWQMIWMHGLRLK